MAISGLDSSQQRAATVVGIAYLLAIPFAVFAEFYVPDRLFSPDYAQTARNIVDHGQLFRMGIASNVAVFALDVVLISALFLALRPVHYGVALVAAFLRLIETGVLLLVPLNDLALVRALGDPSAARMSAEQLAGLVRLSTGAHAEIYGLGLVFAGVGSALFCGLWYRSRYIPRALAALGVLGSVLMGSRDFAMILAPGAAEAIGIAAYAGPIFLFELITGLWLVTRGLAGGHPSPVPGRQSQSPRAGSP